MRGQQTHTTNLLFLTQHAADGDTDGLKGGGGCHTPLTRTLSNCQKSGQRLRLTRINQSAQDCCRCSSPGSTETSLTSCCLAGHHTAAARSRATGWHNGTGWPSAEGQSGLLSCSLAWHAFGPMQGTASVEVDYCSKSSKSSKTCNSSMLQSCAIATNTVMGHS